MNGYTVEWLAVALNELATLWLQAADRRAVTAAQNEADRLLAQDPHGNGRYLSEGLYHIAVRPLVVSYTIDPARRVVQVTWVAQSR